MKSRLLHSALKTSDLRGKSLLSAKRGFNSYLNYLKTNSIASNSVVKQIENTMYSYLNKGINPVVFYDENGVFIEKDIILYKNFQGLGIDPVLAAQLAKEASEKMHKIIDKMMDIPFMDKTFGARAIKQCPSVFKTLKWRYFEVDRQKLRLEYTQETKNI